MPFQIVRDDVTAISADAVVVPSNEQLLISGGVGGQVAAIAGCEQLQAAASAAAPCPAGHAVAVSPGSYPARCIVFATGPQWPGNPQPSALHLLQAANLAALEAAAAQGCQSIALPLISAGSFSFPARHAFACASAAVREFLANDARADIQVTLALFEREAVCAGSALVGEIAELVDDAYVMQRLEHEGERSRYSRRRKASRPALPCLAGGAAKASSTSLEDAICFDALPAPSCGTAQAQECPGDELETMLAHLDEPFSQVLVHLIDAKGMTDPQVYRAANMTRQTFSKIRNNPAMQPTKRSVLALAVALQLTTAETEALLARAGYALSPASPGDVIVRYFLDRGMHNIFDINEMLYRFDQQLL